MPETYLSKPYSEPGYDVESCEPGGLPSQVALPELI